VGGAPLQNRAIFALGGAPTKKSERNSSLRRGYSRQVRAAPEKFGGQAPPSIPTTAPVPTKQPENPMKLIGSNFV